MARKTPREKITFPELYATLVPATTQVPLGSRGSLVFCTATNKPLGVVWWRNLGTDWQPFVVWHCRTPAGVEDNRQTQKLAVAVLREAATAAGSLIRPYVRAPKVPTAPQAPRPKAARAYPAHLPHTRHRTLVPFAPRELDPERHAAGPKIPIVWGRRGGVDATTAVGDALTRGGFRPGVDLHRK